MALVGRSTGVPDAASVPTPIRLRHSRTRVRVSDDDGASFDRATSPYTEGVHMAREAFTADEARQIGEEIGIDWASAPFDVEQFRSGMDVELEHGLHDLVTNVTDDDPVVTGKIALAHLNEFPDYYTRLERMEEQAKRDHGAA
jgi:Protein of unknown function (DUF5661)